MNGMATSITACVVWLLIQCLGSRLAKGACEFPPSWSGRWFQSGVQHHLIVNSTSIETKGNCVYHEGDKFLVEDKLDRCYRCVVIHEKHPNVLQYKETFCVNKHGGLDDLCMQITGDAPLYSMFRYDATPTPCPFRPPFTFTYNRGSGDCNSPVSRADACTEDSRLLLRYQACADVHNSESTVEELVCLAYWKDGSTRYLVGQLQHKMATTDEDRYRCFVWERRAYSKTKVAFDVAQSGDATCNGLLSPTEGSRTMRLTKVESHHHGAESKSCRFPRWLTEHHQWHTLDHKKTFHFSPRNATLKESDSGSSSKVQMRAVCHAYETDSDTQAKIIAHVTTGCHSGYSCFLFYKRDGHVIELQQSSNRTFLPEDACSPSNFNPQILPFATLITATPEVRQCPFMGRYLVTEGNAPSASKQLLEEKITCDQQYQGAMLGCGPGHTMKFYSQCSSEAVSAFSCHAVWSDTNATTRYLIASPQSRKSGGAHRICFVMYNSAESGQTALLQVATVTESCHRHVFSGAAGQYWSFNMTEFGKCDSGGGKLWPLPPLLYLAVTLSLLSPLLSAR
ncbi:uncharacterized protein LOC128993927 [Macrosteles quadrilineatus]|uniref:uncharacterized protein LOC128993927 n=1 Tax=Macrosteles quadrilineatus TaxID=74068 RepID=UPI0023E13DD5|nr:uncharacterized protein LOC128993927 [Macrosteles quadrilineatus]XP_054274025.1 uncharacterized protein LOC128993927 [Macrosteles quadrilineatus]